jgi:hypothetical protein
MSRDTADIHHLPGIPWSPEAALGHVQNRIKDIDKILILSIDKQGRQFYTSAGMDALDRLWAVKVHEQGILDQARK